MKKKINRQQRLKLFFRKVVEAVTRDIPKSIVILTAFLTFFLIFLFSRDNGLLRRFSLSDIEVGSQSTLDLVVNRDVAYTDEEATALKRDAESQLVSPVFRVESQISRRAFDNYNTFSLNFPILLRQELNPESLFLKIQSILPGFFTREQVRLLSGEESRITEILKTGESLLNEYMASGIFSLPDDELISSKRVEIRYPREDGQEKKETELQNIVTLDNFSNDIGARALKGDFPESWVEPLNILMSVFLEENTFYDSQETELKRQKIRDSVEPVTRLLVKGERVLQKGKIVTAEDMVKVRVLGNYTMTVSSYSFFGAALFMILLFILARTLYSPPLIEKPVARAHLIVIMSAFLVYFTLAMLLIRIGKYEGELPISALLPGTVITMLVSILISSRAGIYTTVIFTLGLLLQTRMEPYAFLFAFFTGVLGTIVVQYPEKKGYLLRATVIMAFFSGGMLFIIGLLKGLAFTRILSYFGIGFLNGMACGILAIGILPFLEHILNAPTPSRLMDISDLNTPLFKRMLVLAPGTYSHTISVANLAESAARAIGADALLARAGAFYHDIGKIDQAEYFAENQTTGNKHDELKPTLSTTVIKTHVKIGVEKAKELGLPKEVIDIVAQHHGSGLISYFYIQAMKEHQGNKRITPEDFSYNGIPPQSREAAIVMLADSVEAASRTLVKPNIAKLEKFTWDIIMDKVTKEQMRGCELTFRDMEIIKKTFVQILAGHFHTRIEYPDMKKNTETPGKNKKQ